MLYSIVHDVHTSTAELNHDLSLIKDWAFEWKMAFNPDPAKQVVELIFSQTKIKPSHPPLIFNGAQVQLTDNHKHLGLMLDSKLTFDNHINEKIAIARKGIGIIKSIKTL